MRAALICSALYLLLSPDLAATQVGHSLTRSGSDLAPKANQCLRPSAYASGHLCSRHTIGTWSSSRSLTACAASGLVNACKPGRPHCGCRSTMSSSRWLSCSLPGAQQCPSEFLQCRPGLQIPTLAGCAKLQLDRRRGTLVPNASLANSSMTLLGRISLARDQFCLCSISPLAHVLPGQDDSCSHHDGQQCAGGSRPRQQSVSSTSVLHPNCLPC